MLVLVNSREALAIVAGGNTTSLSNVILYIGHNKE